MNIFCFLLPLFSVFLYCIAYMHPVRGEIREQTYAQTVGMEYFFMRNGLTAASGAITIPFGNCMILKDIATPSTRERSWAWP